MKMILVSVLLSAQVKRGNHEHIDCLNDILSIIGFDSGYTVKNTPLPLGTPSGEGVYLTVHPSSRPNTDTVYCSAEWILLCSATQ